MRKNLLLLFSLFLLTPWAQAGERVLYNPDVDGDVVLRVNRGGTPTDVLRVDGATATVQVGGEAAGGYVPPGAVMMYAGSTAPSGWLLSFGQTVSRATYAALFAAVSTTYGVGDGSTTFGLPDCRGRALAGKDDMGGVAANRLTTAGSGVDGLTLGAVGGAQTLTPSGTIGGSQSIAHTHDLGNHTHNIAHNHQIAYGDNIGGGDMELYFSSSNDDTLTSFTTTSHSIHDATATSGATVRNSIANMSGSDSAFYSTGVLSPPTGSAGASASSGTPSTNTSGPMSANTTVSGSNFSFTGSSGSNAQPTIVMNCIIKY